MPKPNTKLSSAPWGLSVLLQVTGIFTGITISPGLRQDSFDRYTIRAGVYSDKEFRYLRTVIVTAAVHRGFNSSLNPPLNLPALAGVSLHTSPFSLA